MRHVRGEKYRLPDFLLNRHHLRRSFVYGDEVSRFRDLKTRSRGL